MDTAGLRTPTELLDLDGFEVVEAESDRAARVRRLTVVPTAAVAALCPGCGTATADRHACRDREVVDLPLGGWRTGLVVRLWQFACGHCGRYFTPGHPALAAGAHATERFLGRLADCATHGDVSTAARFTLSEVEGEDGRVTRPATAVDRLRAWCAQGRALGLAALAKFNKTPENWMDRIANHFVARSSNGRTEGFNRGLRGLLWRACGMTNFAHFRLRVLHAFG